MPVPDPVHSANALRAGIEMQRAATRRAFAGIRIANRTGVNTGRGVADAVGAKGPLSYTVHGDAVDLGARLDALNKELGTRILVSEATVAQMAGFALRPVGEVRIRGQTGRVAVYALGGSTAGQRDMERTQREVRHPKAVTWGANVMEANRTHSSASSMPSTRPCLTTTPRRAPRQDHEHR